MHTSELFEELFSRVDEHVESTLEDLDADDLAVIPEPASNSIGWLLWHLTRVQDSHIAELADRDQVWVDGDWAGRFGLDAAEASDVGYGHSAEQMARVRPESRRRGPRLLRGGAARTREFLSSVTAADLDRIVDRRWDPPVTMGVRLVSIVDDDIQHAGQAQYVKGLLQRR